MTIASQSRARVSSGRLDDRLIGRFAGGRGHHARLDRVGVERSAPRRTGMVPVGRMRWRTRRQPLSRPRSTLASAAPQFDRTLQERLCRRTRSAGTRAPHTRVSPHGRDHLGPHAGGVSHREGDAGQGGGGLAGIAAGLGSAGARILARPPRGRHRGGARVRPVTAGERVAVARVAPGERVDPHSSGGAVDPDPGPPLSRIDPPNEL